MCNNRSNAHNRTHNARTALIVESSPNLIPVSTEMVVVYYYVRFRYICQNITSLSCVFMENVMAVIIMVDHTICTFTCDCKRTD